MSLIPRMADSVEPWKIPAKFEQQPNGVAIYYDGHFAWAPTYRARFPRHIGITVIDVPAAASYARAIDVETGDADAETAVRFLDLRRKLVPPRPRSTGDGMVYCDRSTVESVLAALNGRDEPWWWIATLDNQSWTPAELAGDIARNHHASISTTRIAAIQNGSLGTYDTSRVFQPMGWARQFPGPAVEDDGPHGASG